MLRMIAVPLDGSPFAGAALPIAMRIAKAARIPLRLVGVNEPVLALVPATDLPMAVEEERSESRARHQSYLSQEAARLGIAGGRPVGYDLVDGMAGSALVQWIRDNEPDLLVMSTHGRGALSRFWLGSVTDYIIRHAPVPVLLTRPGEDAQPQDARFGTALVPLDLSDESEAILEALRDFATLFDTHLTLLHVVQPMPGTYAGPTVFPGGDDLIERNRNAAQVHLDRIADRLRAKGIRVATRVVVAGSVAGTVLHQAEAGRFDFVAMTTHGAGIRRMLLGGVADKVVRGAHRPVLLLRPSSPTG